MNETCLPGGLYPESMKEELHKRVQRLPQGLRDAIGLRFDENDVKYEPLRGDFHPRTIDAMALLRRLDETFDWSLTIRSATFDHVAQVAMAVVSIGWKYYQGFGGASDMQDTHRDGVGSVRLEYDQAHRIINPDFALSQAVTEAIKHAAKHVGLTRQLWDKGTTALTPAAQQARQEQAAPQQGLPAGQFIPAPKFQIDVICKYFEEVGKYPREQWLALVQRQSVEHIDATLASALLNKQHPFAQYVEKHTGKPITGVFASAAR